MQHRTLARAMLIGVAALGAWTATELADDGAAHADAKPAVTLDRPGGPAEHTAKLPPRLPQQASARAKAAVAKVTAEPKPEPTEDQAEPPAPPREDPPPADEPTEDKPAEDKPRNEPTPPVETPPADKPPVEVPPVELPVPTPPAETPLPPVEVPPLPSPPPVELPAPAPPVELPPAPRTDPVPLPPADLPPLPAPAPAPVVAPGPLPAAVSPVPVAEPPPAGSVVDQLIAELTAGETTQPQCADDPDDARHIDRDALRALLAGLDSDMPPTAAASDRNPCRPQIPAVNNTGAGQVNPPPPSGAELIVADLVGSHVPPALGRLEHVRPRAHLPTSRHVAIEPGPA